MYRCILGIAVYHISICTTLTEENANDLERTQKTFAKLILGKNYINYEKALIKLNLVPLSERRQEMCRKFANSGIKNNTLSDFFTENLNNHAMLTRKSEKFQVDFCNTERFRKSSVIHMQNLLNEAQN